MALPHARLAFRLLAVAAFLAFAAPAQAGTLSFDGGTLVYRAAPGEANDVNVTAQGSGAGAIYNVTDAGALVVPSLSCLGGCKGNVREVVVLLGDGNDSARMPGAYGAASGYVEGGPGDDRLTGGRTGVSGRNPETIDGGPGRDALAPRDGGRALGGADADVLACAGGSLGCYLEGGEGDDVLGGGPQTDALGGGPGVDFMNGRGGPDAASGGPGDDRINSQDGVPEAVFCDEGDGDGVTGDPEDSTYSCELASFTLAPVARAARRVVTRGSAARRGRWLYVRATTRIAQASRGTKVPCSGGKVRFRVLLGNRVGARKATKVPRGCAAKVRLRIRLKRRELSARAVRVSAAYLGNGWLQPRAGKLRTLRVRGARR